jgi:RNA polymerase sigma-70 factor (ECF subfamily)
VEPRLRLVPPPGPEPDGDAPAAADATVELVAALKAGEAWAANALAAAYGEHVRRVLFRVLGSGDRDAADLAQETFLRALRGIGQLEDPRSLKAWLTHVAVFTARGELRRRRRWRWLPFSEADEGGSAWAGPELEQAAEAVYRIFDRMPADERIPFALRAMMGLDLAETAAACGMSFSTVRRRLERAERRFFKLAREYEALVPWVASAAQAAQAVDQSETETQKEDRP